MEFLRFGHMGGQAVVAVRKSKSRYWGLTEIKAGLQGLQESSGRGPYKPALEVIEA